MTTQPQFRAITERRNLDNIGLNAALVGAVSTGVLRWNLAAFVNNGIAAGVPPPGTWPAQNLTPTIFWAREVNDANVGTTIKIERRGQWLATLSANTIAAATAALGISYATDNPAQLSAPGLLAADTPLNTAAGIRQGLLVTAAAAAVSPITLTALITVSDRDAGDQQSGIIRFHGNDGAAGILIEEANIVDETVRFTIAYMGDVKGS